MQHIDVFSTKHIPNRFDSDVVFSIADTAQRYALSELLPYDPKTKSGDRLANGLKEYDLLLAAAERAMELLSKDEIAGFDPLVGENACQIRAVKNCLIFSQYPIDFNRLLNKLRYAKRKIEDLFLQISVFIESEISLDKLLESESLVIMLTYSEIYLIKSFLLTVVKTSKPPKDEFPFVKNEYTDIKKLKAIKSVGTMFAESLIKKLRESLSGFSASFVKELSSRVEGLNIARKINSDKFHVRHNRLHCLPCYWMTKILMFEALKSRIPLVVIARQMAKDKNYEIIGETTLFFKPTACGYEYTTEPNPFDSNQAAFVLLGNACRNSYEFPGLACWQKELSEYNPIDLVLAYAAAHRQYPNAELDYMIDQVGDERYNFYKAKASEWGCSIENPSLFFLSHAFCEKIKYVSRHFYF